MYNNNQDENNLIMNLQFDFGLPYITVIIFWLATVFITDIELDKIDTTKKYEGKDDFS